MKEVSLGKQMLQLYLQLMQTGLNTTALIQTSDASFILSRSQYTQFHVRQQQHFSSQKKITNYLP